MRNSFFRVAPLGNGKHLKVSFIDPDGVDHLVSFCEIGHLHGLCDRLNNLALRTKFDLILEALEELKVHEQTIRAYLKVWVQDRRIPYCHSQFYVFERAKSDIREVDIYFGQYDAWYVPFFTFNKYNSSVPKKVAHDAAQELNLFFLNGQIEDIESAVKSMGEVPYRTLQLVQEHLLPPKAKYMFYTSSTVGNPTAYVKFDNAYGVPVIAQSFDMGSEAVNQREASAYKAKLEILIEDNDRRKIRDGMVRLGVDADAIKQAITAIFGSTEPRTSWAPKPLSIRETIGQLLELIAKNEELSLDSPLLIGKPVPDEPVEGFGVFGVQTISSPNLSGFHSVLLVGATAPDKA